MSADEYDMVAKGKLRLKVNDSSCEIKKNKKHKKKKDKEKLERAAAAASAEHNESTERSSNDSTKLKMTKAEMAFKKMQEKMVCYF